MHISLPRLRIALVALYTLLSFFTVARAQIGPPLLVKPWPEKNEAYDGRADVLFFNAGHTLENNDRFHLSMYSSEGRFRILPGNEISPRVGYEFDFLDLHTSNPRLPNQLSDEAVAFGTGLFKRGNWIGAMTVGVGYAGDRAFGNGAGWFGTADLMLVDQLNETDYLGLVLDYDGHRTYAPDIPLPGFGYSHRFDPKLQAVLGLPYSAVIWKPIPRLELDAEYELLTDLRVNVGYEFVHKWTVYGMWDYSREAFHVSNLPRDRRLLFFQYRAEAGVRFTPIPQLTAGVGVGYGFDGQFRSGFDYQRTHYVAEFTDEPYIRGEMTFRF
jgi:hypothetical protein